MKWIKQTSRAWRIPVVVLMSMLMQFNAFAQECNPDDLYDAIVSAYHQSFAKKSDGSWSAWGQLMASNGTGAVLSPQDINVTNYPGMTGTPLLASTASGGSGATEQSVLLTTTGLFVWGAENVIVNTSLTSSAAFQALTIGGNASGLPTGVLPTDVHQLFANYGTLSILTNSGALYVLGINGVAHPAMLGDATATVDQTWHRVKTNSSTFLSNVIAVRGHNASSTKGAMMALCYNGVSYSAYTWGPSTYLGGGGATASYNYATAMTLPSGTPKMIGVTGGNSASRNNSYFVLMTNGSLYSLGANDVKQLGDFSTTERLSWVNVKQTASANFTNVKFISAQEHDAKYPSAAIITNAGDLYVWGENNGNMLGAADGTYNPFLPGGFTSGTDVAKFVEVGGHTTVYVKENSAKFCYVGHRTNGSMGDGTSTSTNETTFNCSATPNINICGSTGWDYGDAPVAYENGGGSNLAFHFYVSSPNSIYLGASGPISNDDAPKNVVLATDNNGSLGDGTEENSVASFPAIGTSATTYSFNITLKNSLGSNANLYVWVDWNNNRRFESTEIYTTTVASNAAIQTKTATFSGLTGLTEGRRYVRIRFTSQSLTDVAGTTNWDERALGFASDGEMEDFNLVIGTLTGVNVPPTTSNVTHSGVILSSDGAMDIDNPVGADTDGSVVAYRIISLPSKGTLYKLVGLSLFNVALNQALTAEEANNLNYDPSGLSEGVDSFQLAAIDDDGAEDATPATYTINISCSADTDGDGICDANEIPGCQDPTACNYNAAATDNNGSCTYPAQTYLNCAGNCINDTDNDGICNELEVPGCTDPTACNYNAAATDNNGSCTYPAQTYLNCAGNCINDTDNDGICNELEVPGCTDPTACNYNAAATDDNASCTYPAQTYLNCDGSCINDTDNDGVCNELEVPGCTDPTACNYNAAATDNNGSCTYPAQTYLNCAGNCINDTDNDGICNELEVPGCTDPTACNYNAAATDNNGSCTYPAQTYLNCDGSCINDTDNDGICNEVEIPGCTDPTACNYNAAATDDNASCTYASLEYYADNDGDGFGAGDASLYCTDPGAGYVTDNTDCDDTNASVNSAATEVCNLIDDDCDGEIDEFVTTTYYADLDGDGFGDLNNATESCSLPGGYSENSDDCDDNLLSYEDFDEDGYGTDVIVPCGANNSLDCDDFNPSIYVGGSEICGNGIDENCDGVDEVCIVNGCTDPSACNYNASANQEDGTCTYPAQSYLNCDGTCINDTDGDGVCNEIEVPGCTDPSACNYNAAATDEDASCTYPAQTYLNCDGSCINDTDGDGVCNEIEVPGCTDPTACNYDAAATDEDASCTYPAQSYLNCDGSCINDTDNDGVCNELEVPGCTDPSACNYDAAATDEDESCAFASLTFYLDADGDGFGFGDGTLYCTNPGEGFAENNSDCDDSNANISPNAEEICNLIDDDCDAEVDEFVTFTYYADVDGDGYGNASETVEACELPEGYTNNQEDCDDALLTFQDLDGDGMGSSIPDACGSVSNEDCDDNNAQIFVGATEICGNDVDEDCDGQDLICPLEGCTDSLACNYNPLAEIENGSCTYPASSSVGCNGMCIADTDGDGICDPDEIPGCTHVDACNFNSLATDDDESCIYPEPLYNCDGTCINDTDEDGVCNELEVIGCQDESACNFNASATDPSECTYPSLPYYVDEDGDNVGVGEIVLLCEVPTSGYADHPGDCDDTNPTIYAGAIELCNGVDDDCDSEIDEGVLLTFYIDTDGDGFGDNNSSIEACTAPEGYVNNDSDCDDTQVTYTDLDGDGYGSEGWVACGSYFNNDCDDNNAGINPNQTEICGNGADEDCSGDDAVCPLIVATDNNYLANEDETNIILDVLVNDNATATSILPSTLDLDVATPGIQSTVTTPAGTWTANASGQIVFTPNSNYNSILNGDAVLTYQVSDANGVISNVATVTVEITPVEDSPIIVEEMIDSLTPFQTPVEICLDAQEVDGQDNFIINVFGPNNGTVSGLEGTDYCFTYIPDSTFSGLDSIAVMMCDSGEGSICDTVWIIIEVGLGAPIAHNDESTINEDELIILNVLENDNSGDLVIDIASVDLDPSIPGIQQSYTNSDGIWSVDGNGNLAFTPSVNFNGDAHLFYTVNDTTGSTSNIALVTIHVLPVNDAPQVLDENQTVQDETNYETPIVVCINVQDVDGDNLTMTSLNGPSNGGLGQMDDGDLCFEYTPNSGFVGLDSVALVICDNGIPSLCDTVYVYINVVPTAPVVNDDNGSVNEDESVTLAILENDVTNGAALDLNTIDLDPVSPGVQSVITTSEGTWTVDGSGILNFVPAANFNGNASINYVVSDINGNLSNTGVVNISVNPINDAPNAPAVVIESTPFETAIVVCIDPSSVTDADGDQVSITSVVTDPTNGLASNVNDGDLCFTYTPNVNFTGLDSMLVTVCDNGIPSLCDTIWIYVNVEGTSPIATDDYVNSNTATVSIDVALNDIIPGNVDYTVSIVDSTSNGSVVMNGSLISYTPNFGFCGTDSLTYALCNAMGMCDTAMLIIDVTPTDADSDGISDYYETLEGDADEDGTPNYLDTDSDNDGVSDAEEAGTNSLCDANFKDCDNDGTPDYLDFFTCGVQLEIPEGFSPNGDNTNDTWVIPGVSEFPENTITVFNRWGTKVYAKSPYDNSWDGTCNENAIGGNLLPEGTYFYVFTTGPNGETKNGYVYIKR